MQYCKYTCDPSIKITLYGSTYIFHLIKLLLWYKILFIGIANSTYTKYKIIINLVKQEINIILKYVCFHLIYFYNIILNPLKGILYITDPVGIVRCLIENFLKMGISNLIVFYIWFLDVE